MSVTNQQRAGLAAAAVAMIAVGAGSMYLWLSPSLSHAVARTGRESAVVPSQTRPAPDGSRGSGDAAAADSALTLSAEAVQRAGIRVVTATAGTTTSTHRLPGVVEPDAYAQVVVTPLAAGRVTRVLAALGQRVRQGEALAQIYSPEVSEAFTRHLTLRAELEAHERELQRTQKLVEIGAASRQELDRLHAEHTARLSEVESARSRLQLLGVSAEATPGTGADAQSISVLTVAAPISGVVTERLANVGLNVDSGSRLFTVVDLSRVWVVADVYEQDLSGVAVGTPATVTARADPATRLAGKVSYIDPQVSTETRTTRVRIELPNPRGELRFGMYVDVAVERTGTTPVAIVPGTAIQHVGSRVVAYVADPVTSGRFIERQVQLGESTGETVAILTGVSPGERVVADGSFTLRAERERLGLQGATRGDRPRASTQLESPDATPGQEATVTITEQGFEPATVTVRPGIPTRLTFIRKTDKTCATEVVFPSLAIRRGLPLNEPTVIEFTPGAPAQIAFACGMDMLHGTVVVRQ